MKNEITEQQVLDLLFYLENESQENFKKWLTGVNIFEVLKISNTEIRHSNILGWLLTPTENHKLYDKFFKKIVYKILLNNDSTSEISLLDTVLKDFSDAEVFRESKKNIDILFSSKKNKFNLVIENKIWSSDHDNQLEKYRKYIGEKYPKYKNMYVYLTPDGDEPTEADEIEREYWQIMSYKEIANILDGFLADEDIDEKVRYILKEYVDNLKRNILKDEELKELSTKIYLKHREVLDMIFQNLPDYETDCRKNIIKFLKEVDNENIINDDSMILQDRKLYRIKFRTKFLDGFLDNQIDANKEIKHEDSKYWYEVANNKDTNFFNFQLVLLEPNNPDELSSKVKVFYDSNTKNYNKWGKIFKSFFSVNIEEACEGDLEQSIQNFVERGLKEIQKFEDELESEYEII